MWCLIVDCLFSDARQWFFKPAERVFARPYLHSEQTAKVVFFGKPFTLFSIFQSACEAKD